MHPCVSPFQSPFAIAAVVRPVCNTVTGTRSVRCSLRHPAMSSAGKLYSTHIPLSVLQRGALTLGAAVGAFLKPARADLVAAVGELTGTRAFERMCARMKADPVGQRILSERPRITVRASNSSWARCGMLTHPLLWPSAGPGADVLCACVQNETMHRCAAAPAGSLGAEYAAFMAQRHFEADARPAVRYVDNEELAYVATRVRETHDLWHVLFNCPTTIFGETALKALEFVQARRSFSWPSCN